jgi:hypothetical protein
MQLVEFVSKDGCRTACGCSETCTPAS